MSNATCGRQKSLLFKIYFSDLETHQKFATTNFGEQNTHSIILYCTTIESVAHGTGLETAIFHTPMRVAQDVISQHFRTNLLHPILVRKKTIFSKREQEVMDKNVLPIKVEAHATLTGDIMYIIESVDSISRDAQDVPLTQYITNA